MHDDPDESEMSPMAKVPVKRVTVKSVVAREMKQAKGFVEDLLKIKPGKPTVEIAKPSSKPTPTQKATTTPRHEDILIVFRLLMELEDGTVEEADLTNQLNQQLCKTATPFQTTEVQQTMETLELDGKIMRSDGVIFWV